MSKRKKPEAKEETVDVKTPQKARDAFVAALKERVAGWLIGDWLEDVCSAQRAGCSEEEFTRVRAALEAEFPPETWERMAEEILVQAREKAGREELSINETKAVLMASLSDEYLQSVLSRRIEALLAPAGAQENWQAKAEEYLHLARSVQADFENYRKRRDREMDEFRRSATRLLVKALLPVLDAMDHAQAAARKDEKSANDEAGLAKIRKLLFQVLQKEGLEELPAAGQPFDPQLHEALTYDEGDGEGIETVGEVIRPGYRLGDQLLRAALVQVVMAPAPEVATEETPSDGTAAPAEPPSDAVEEAQK